MQPVTVDVNGFTMLLEHVLFSDHKDLFLRELICNALDALIRLKLNNTKSENPRIEIIAEHNARTLTIKDNGIGMTKSDLQSYLGQICQSGTKKHQHLIGCRGIGFRSTYPVTDTIVITSKHIDEVHQGFTMTFSEDKTSFSIQQNKQSCIDCHGTQISLNLKANASEYTNELFIRYTVAKYFKLIQFPIYFAHNMHSDHLQFELLNPYWDALPMHQIMNKSIKTTGIDAKSFDLFYKYICNDIEHDFDHKTLINGYIRMECVTDIPLSIVPVIISFYPLRSTELMFKRRCFVEGQLEFGMCLFVANDEEQKANRCQLYIKNMFIEYCDDILPKYLEFIQVVIQSHDLPLNWTKTSVTNAKIYKVITRIVYKKALQSMLDFAKNKTEEYEEKFYPLYSKNLKLLAATVIGLIGDVEGKYNYKVPMIMELLRFKTSMSGSSWVSLRQYNQNMKHNQYNIYYAFAEDVQHLKKYKELNIEVILFDDGEYDRYVVQVCDVLERDTSQMHMQCISS
eukprot:40221_1